MLPKIEFPPTTYPVEEVFVMMTVARAANITTSTITDQMPALFFSEVLEGFEAREEPFEFPDFPETERDLEDFEEDLEFTDLDAGLELTLEEPLTLFFAFGIVKTQETYL